MKSHYHTESRISRRFTLLYNLCSPIHILAKQIILQTGTTMKSHFQCDKISFLFPRPTVAINPPSVLYSTLTDDGQGSQNLWQ